MEAATILFSFAHGTSVTALVFASFPVVEGVLQKKGGTGLRRWQERYFAFNGNVMSYWRSKQAVGKERPSGIYHPNQIQSVNINRKVAKRFNIQFLDGKVGELGEHTSRWGGCAVVGTCRPQCRTFVDAYFCYRCFPCQWNSSLLLSRSASAGCVV
jgi:hypothetical protein